MLYKTNGPDGNSKSEYPKIYFDAKIKLNSPIIVIKLIPNNRFYCINI